MKVSSGSFMILLMLSCLWNIAFAEYRDSDDWELVSDKERIRVYQQDIDGSDHHVVRATVNVAAGLRKTVAFLQDESINTRWVPYSGGATLLGRPVPEKSFVHFIVESSWPFKARDAIALFQIRQARDLELTIKMTNYPDYLPEHPGRIRMQTYAGYWRLNPVEPDTTKVIYESHVDPGGSIPSWLANRLALETAWQALANLREQIQDYRNPDAINGRLGFVKELPPEAKQE